MKGNYCAALLSIAAVLLAAGCKNEPDVVDVEPPAKKMPVKMGIDASANENGVSANIFEVPQESAVDITISGLDNKDIFLVQLNLSDRAINDRIILSTGDKEAPSAAKEDPSAEAIRAVSGMAAASRRFPEDRVIRVDYEKALYYEPPPFTANGGVKPLPNSRSVGPALPAGASRAVTALAAAYEMDESTRKFWVDGRKDGEWYEIDATLRFQNDTCFIWVADGNYDASGSGGKSDNRINSAQALELGQKFTAVYAKETAVFGHEYGGADGESGGVDGLKAVQILVYDIHGDFTESQNGGTIGYFWAKDMFTQAALDEKGDKSKTNWGEIFYMDTHFIDRYPDTAYSTLIHEFQHMILYNQKNVKQSKNPATWYNEMLSMLAEDLLDEFIAIPAANSAHPVSGRMPLFLGTYNCFGTAAWVRSDPASYSSAYAFGAYLARNFGGPALICEIVRNDAVDEQSVIDAVNKLNGGEWTFDKLLEKFAETLVFTGSDDKNYSFNKTVQSEIAGTPYTFQAFDVSAIERLMYNSLREEAKGPYFFGLAGSMTLDVNAFAVFTDFSWKGVSGSITINMEKRHENTKVFIMLKDKEDTPL